MKRCSQITILIIFSIFTINLFPTPVYAQETKNYAHIEKTNPEIKPVVVKPLDLVNNPQKFLNKEIKMYAQFNKFSTLGLDYDRAFRSSKDFISILIKRPDVAKEYTIPLSELKLILKRDDAEKLLDIESGDKIEITGKVFSTALNDPWVDIYKLKNLEVKQSKDLDKESDG